MLILLNIGTVRAKVIVNFKLSLFSKLEKITALELGKGAMAGGNPKVCQGIKGDLHVKVSFNRPQDRIETSAA